MGGLPIQSSPGESGWRSTRAHRRRISGTTNRGESGKAALDDVEAVFRRCGHFVSGWPHAILGENAPELEEDVRLGT